MAAELSTIISDALEKQAQQALLPLPTADCAADTRQRKRRMDRGEEAPAVAVAAVGDAGASAAVDSRHQQEPKQPDQQQQQQQQQQQPSSSSAPQPPQQPVTVRRLHQSIAHAQIVQPPQPPVESQTSLSVQPQEPLSPAPQQQQPQPQLQLQLQLPQSAVDIRQAIDSARQRFVASSAVLEAPSTPQQQQQQQQRAARAQLSARQLAPLTIPPPTAAPQEAVLSAGLPIVSLPSAGASSVAPVHQPASAVAGLLVSAEMVSAAPPTSQLLHRSMYGISVDPSVVAGEQQHHHQHHQHHQRQQSPPRPSGPSREDLLRAFKELWESAPDPKVCAVHESSRYEWTSDEARVQMQTDLSKSASEEAPTHHATLQFGERMTRKYLPRAVAKLQEKSAAQMMSVAARTTYMATVAREYYRRLQPPVAVAGTQQQQQQQQHHQRAVAAR